VFAITIEYVGSLHCDIVLLALEDNHQYFHLNIDGVNTCTSAFVRHADKYINIDTYQLIVHNDINSTFGKLYNLFIE
jgi:hypothetical protein